MKRTRIIHSGLITMLAISSGCDKDELIYDLPHEPTKLVVNFPGVNDEFWLGDVSLSAPILSPFHILQQPAGTTVRIFEDGVFVETLSPTQGFLDTRYESKLNSPMPGHTYRVEVVTQDYGTVTSSYVQPTLVLPTAFESKKLGPVPATPGWPDMGGENVSFRVSFKDPPGGDFYEILIKASWEFPEYHKSAQPLDLEMIDPPYRKLKNEYSGSLGFILDDERFDGQEASFLFKSQYFYSDHRGSVTPGYFWVEIRHLSPEYYQYIVTDLLQINTAADPYAQPVKVFSNIDGGYGLFGGFTRSLTRFEAEY